MKKIVFLDVDGTLIPEGGNAPLKSTRDSIKKLQSQDIGVALCTGRHPTEIKTLGLLDIPYDGFVLLNGQLCLDKNMNKLYSNPIYGRDKEEILEIFDKMEVPVVIVEEKRLYLNFVNDRVVKAQADVASLPHETGKYHGADILMSTIFDDGIFKFTSLRTGRWHKYAIDIYPTTGGKVNGIKHFIRHFEMDMADVVAFGDAENDIDMIKTAGIGVAMGNAYPETKEVADYVTDDSDKDGIEKGLKHLGLI